MSVSQLAELSNLSKAYISQVKHGKRPPSEKLINALVQSIHHEKNKSIECLNTLQLFLKTRREGISSNTLRDYRITLSKALLVLGLTPTTKAVNRFLSSLTCSMCGKYGYFKDLRAFHNWLYSPRSGMGFHPDSNPIKWVDAPERPRLILPSLSKEQVSELLAAAINIRDKTIIALFAESGLRLSELTTIKPSDIDWQHRLIRVLGKEKKEAYAPFGELSNQCLKEWLSDFNPYGGNIWGLNQWGITSMLRRLQAKTELPCNPHTFRRTFACLLRKAGVDTMTIKDLGRWESLEMVQRYTRSVTFHDSMKFYKAPLS